MASTPTTRSRRLGRARRTTSDESWCVAASASAFRDQPEQAPSQGLALASMIVAIAGLVLGGCLGPLPGIVALVLG